MSRAPTRYVEPEITDARLNRLWANVSAGLAARPARLRRWYRWSGATIIAALGAALVLHASTPHPPLGVGHATASVELRAAASASSFELAEGSQVSLAAGSTVQVHENTPSGVSLALSQGEAEFDVTHRNARRFTVMARDVQVRVIGTRFTVKTGPGPDPRIEVSVLRGVVEVESRRRPGVLARVAAGQTWIQNPNPSPPVPTANGVTELAPKEASTDLDRAGSPAREEPNPPASGAASPPALSARDLFDKASKRRRAGDAAGAARAYEELLRAYPGDRRAGLSAFELGRLRMDRLRDAPGAVTALEHALALDLGPGFREDALARLVSVFAAQGDLVSCVRARDRYLKGYPSGVHALTVASRCASR